MSEEFIAAVENSLFDLYNTIDGTLEVILDEKYSQHISHKVDASGFNRCRILPEGKGNEQEIIYTCLERYRRIGKQKVSWFVGPMSSTPDIAQALLDTGFEKMYRVHGMIYEIDNDFSTMKPIKDFPFTIKSHPIEFLKTADFQHVVESAYGMTPGGGSFIAEVFYSMRDSTPMRIFIGYDRGTADPVGFGLMFPIPHTQIVVLGGAATNEAYRGMGLYGAMLYHRLHSAKTDGFKYAVIQARDTTSAPIAAKHGFEKICDIDRYQIVLSS